MAAPTTDADGIQQTVRTLMDCGWQLVNVQCSGETWPVGTEQAAMDILTDLDDGFLVVSKDNEEGWVRFVMGNDAPEVVCDYTLNLDCVTDLTDAWWEGDD
jgi:hypothetical protein